MQSATGFAFHPGLLDRSAQERLLAALQAALVEAPFFVPVLPPDAAAPPPCAGPFPASVTLTLLHEEATCRHLASFR